MWLLTSDEGERTYLRVPDVVKIGRKHAHVTLHNDSSISRLHAVIAVKRTVGLKNDTPSVCTLRDNSSKYGTFLIENGQAIEIPKDGHVLKDKDKIRFGLQNSVFTVTYVPFVTSASCLSENDQCQLEVLIEKLDGVITRNWSEQCTHLTVTSATLTEKTVCALAFGMYIVGIDYWHAVQKAVNNSSAIPDARLHTPQLNETSIDKDTVSLEPNKKRRTLFTSLTFVFFDAKQYKAHGRMISVAGGNSIFFARRPLERKKMCASNIIVMRWQEGSSQSQYSQDTQCSQDYQVNKEEYAAVCDALKERKRRTVLASEIALAVLHCSREKYCNPTFLFESMLKSSQRITDKLKTSDVIALDTQDVLLNVCPRQLPEIISEVRIRKKENIVQLLNATKNDISRSLENDCIPETESYCHTQTSPVQYVHQTNKTAVHVNKDVQLKDTKCVTSPLSSTNDAKKRLRPLSSDEETTVAPVRNVNIDISTPSCGETKRAKTTLAENGTLKNTMNTVDTNVIVKPQKKTVIILAPYSVVNKNAAEETLTDENETIPLPESVIPGSPEDERRGASKTFIDKNKTHVPIKDTVFETSTPSAKTNHDATKTTHTEINAVHTSPKNTQFVTSTPLPTTNCNGINPPLSHAYVAATPTNDAEFVTSTPFSSNTNDANAAKKLKKNTDIIEESAVPQISILAPTNQDTDELQRSGETPSLDRVENKGLSECGEPTNVSGGNGLSGSSSSPEFNAWIDATSRHSPKTISDEPMDTGSSSRKSSPTTVLPTSPSETSSANASTTSAQPRTMHTFLRPVVGRKTFRKAKLLVPKECRNFLRFTVKASSSNSTHSSRATHSTHSSHSPPTSDRD